MVDYSRRSIILGTLVLTASGLGVTAAISGLQGNVEGQADVQAEQALTVTEVSVGGNADASFTRVSDDNTDFQAAAEMNNGDSVAFQTAVENSASDTLSVRVTVDTPESVDVEVVNAGSKSGLPSGANGVDADDDGSTSNAVQTGEDTYMMKIPGESSQGVGAVVELDDTASAGSYDIGVAISPVSTDSA